jgi:hypothetical protein
MQVVMAYCPQGKSLCYCRHDPAEFLCNPILAFITNAVAYSPSDLQQSKDVLLKMCSREAITSAKSALWKGRESVI